MSLPRWTHLRGTIMERTANSKLIRLSGEASVGAAGPTPLTPTTRTPGGTRSKGWSPVYKSGGTLRSREKLELELAFISHPAGE